MLGRGQDLPKIREVQISKKNRSTFFYHDFQTWLQCDYSVITVWLQCDYVENELSLFLRNPDTFFDAFYCCRWNLFFRSCKTFSTTLICLMMIPKKSHFSFKETKISYVIVWMTLAIHRSVAKTQKISIQIIIAYEKICDYFCAGGRSKKMLSTYKR